MGMLDSGLPLRAEIMALLRVLLGVPVVVNPAAKPLLSPLFWSSLVRDDRCLSVLCGVDLPLAAYLGAALVGIPKSAAEECIRANRLDDSYADAVQERPKGRRRADLTVQIERYGTGSLTFITLESVGWAKLLGGSMRFLIVDDSKTMRLIVRRSLRQVGYQAAIIDEAPDGTDAIAMVNKQQYDLVLSGWNMTKMDGPDMLMALNAAGEKLRVGFVTSEGGEDLVRKVAVDRALAAKIK
jgi:two-component system chemotaxis response regulator CheY